MAQVQAMLTKTRVAMARVNRVRLLCIVDSSWIEIFRLVLGLYDKPGKTEMEVGRKIRGSGNPCIAPGR
jgi:hypothetical protein